MVSVVALNCPVCGAPFAPGAERCGYCRSILVLQTDHPRIDPGSLNRTVIDQRIADYRELLRTDPTSVTAHYGLGVAYFNLGLTEAAIRSLEKASGITPENPHIHTQLAVAWREEAKSGNPEAVEELRDHTQYALRLDPDNVEALIMASEEARRDHDIEQAWNYAKRAMALDPVRARELHERTRDEWIAWKRQRGEPEPEDAMPAPAPASDRTRATSPAGEPLSPARAALKGLGRAVLITVGIFFAGIFATAIHDSLATVFAWIVLISFLLWIILPLLAARRAANTTTTRTPLS